MQLPRFISVITALRQARLARLRLAAKAGVRPSEPAGCWTDEARAAAPPGSPVLAGGLDAAFEAPRPLAGVRFLAREADSRVQVHGGLGVVSRWPGGRGAGGWRPGRARGGSPALSDAAELVRPQSWSRMRGEMWALGSELSTCKSQRNKHCGWVTVGK